MSATMPSTARAEMVSSKSALMDWALAEAGALGADEIQLSVWSGNTDAQRFYQRYGFARVADTHFWVGEQCDEEFLFARMI